MAALSQRCDFKLLNQLADAEIVGRVTAGDTALFELIMRRYNRRLFRIARGLLGNDAEAEDAVQEAYVCAWFKLDQFRGPEGFASWICRIATNEALMRRRRLKGIRFASMDVADEAAPDVAQSGWPTSSASPEADVHEYQLRALMERAVDTLPDAYRDAFVLREMEELSVADTASCLGIEPGAVKTRVHRARKLLQQALAGELSTALAGAFQFDGDRCDRLVAAVFGRINSSR